MSSKSYKDSDEESRGSLDDFIVEDEDVDMAAAADTVEEPEEEAMDVEEDAGSLELLAQEAARIAGTLTGTVVGGRTLRSRDPKAVEARKTKDTYYERFGRHDEAKLMEKFTKKDIIEFVGTLKAEYKEAYEASGQVWPTMTTRMSLEAIRAEYDKIKAFADLPDSDDESEEESSEDDSSDADASSDDSDDDDSSTSASDEDESDKEEAPTTNK